MTFDINSKNENLFNQFENSQMAGNLAGKFSLDTKNAKNSNLGAKKFAGLGGGELKSSFKKELSKLIQEPAFISKTKSYKNLDVAHIEKIESMKVEKNDAQFFLNLLEKSGITTNVATDMDGKCEAMQNQKSANVSKAIMNLLQKANDTKKPVRLDFDNNITLVLRVDKEGKVDAQFFPSDKIAEEYLKNNIPFLKQQFEQKEIRYSNINYHSQKDENHQKNKQQKEENDE